MVYVLAVSITHYTKKADGWTIHLSPSAFFVFVRFKLRFQTIGVPIAAHQQLLDVGFLVQDFSAQLVIGNHPVVAVVLQGASAHFEPCRHLLVSKELFVTWRSLVACVHSFDAFKQGIQFSDEADLQFTVGKNQVVHNLQWI